MPIRPGGPPWRSRPENRFAPEKHVLLHDNFGVCVVEAESVARALVRVRGWSVECAKAHPPRTPATAYGPVWEGQWQAARYLRRNVKVLATSYPSGRPLATAEELWALRDAGREMSRGDLSRNPFEWHIPADVAKRVQALQVERPRAMRRTRDASHEMER